MTNSDLISLRRIASLGSIVYSGHAMDRMLERGITTDEVQKVLESGTNQLIEVQSPSSLPGKCHTHERSLIYDPKIGIEVIVIIIMLGNSIPKIKVVTVEKPTDEKWERRPGNNPSLIRK